jgi:hypothetical protein
MQALDIEEIPRYGSNYLLPRDKVYTKPGKGVKLPSVGYSEKETLRK